MNIRNIMNINNINNDYFIIYKGKLLSKNINISEFININNHKYNHKYNNIEIIARQRGGGLVDLFNSLIQIALFFFKILKFIEWIAEFIWWFIHFLTWVFTDLFNGTNLAKEFFNSMMVLLVALLRLPFDLFSGFFQMIINGMSDWMQGFWGWDQSSLSKADKESKYFKTIDKNKGAKYYLTNSNTVPFSVILGTILCPPMGVFMDMGTSGWLNIIVCCLLTLVFYIPGLFYALLIIYS